jgi:hypothetical protein
MNAPLLLDSGVWVATVDSDDPFELVSRRLIATRGRRLGALDLTLRGRQRGRPEAGKPHGSHEPLSLGRTALC